LELGEHYAVNKKLMAVTVRTVWI